MAGRDRIAASVTLGKHCIAAKVRDVDRLKDADVAGLLACSSIGVPRVGYATGHFYSVRMQDFDANDAINISMAGMLDHLGRAETRREVEKLPGLNAVLIAKDENAVAI